MASSEYQKNISIFSGVGSSSSSSGSGCGRGRGRGSGGGSGFILTTLKQKRALLPVI